MTFGRVLGLPIKSAKERTMDKPQLGSAPRPL